MNLTPEESAAVSFVEWVRWNLPPDVSRMLIHIPNERKCSPATRKLFGRIGVRGGVSDYQLGIPIGCYPSLWIELKQAEDPKPATKAQVEWLRDVRRWGAAGAVAIGAHAAAWVLTSYLEDSISWNHHKETDLVIGPFKDFPSKPLLHNLVLSDAPTKGAA